MEQSRKIEDYIALNANKQSLEKGKRISKTISNFGEYSIDMQTQVARFRIMGTFFYSVKIENFLGKIQSECSCPYDWGGICKHQVAALFFLSDYLKSNSHSFTKVYTDKTVKVKSSKLKRPANVKPIRQRNASEPFVIYPYLPLRQEAIDENSGNIVRNIRFSFSLSNIKYIEDSVLFEIIESTFYWNVNEKKHKVSFSKKDDSLVTVCSCNTKTEKLCIHQEVVLNSVLKNFGKNFFEILEPGFMDKNYLAWSLKTGIPNEMIRDYYDFDLISRTFIAKSAAAGLISFNGQSAQEIYEKHTLHFHKIQNLSLPVESNDSGKALEMGYVFSFEEPFWLTLIPITGAPSGTEWLKYIKEYSHKNTPLHLDEIDESILAIINEVDNRNAESSGHYSFPLEAKELSLQQFYYKKLTRLFELMEDSKHLYFRYPGNNGKIQKSQLIPAKLSAERPTLFFELGEESIFYTLKAKLKLGDEILNLEDPAMDMEQLFLNFLIMAHRNELYLQPSIQQASTLFEMKDKTSVLKCIKQDFDPFFEQIVKTISLNYPIEYGEMKDIKHQVVQLEPQERQLYITELGSFILFKPVIVYDHEKSVNIREEITLTDKQGKEITVYQRDQEYESEYFDFMVSLHPEFEKQRLMEFFFLPFTALTRDSWFFNVFEKFTEAGINVFGVNDLKAIQYSPFKAKIRTHIKSGQDWFDVSIEIAFGDEVIKLSEVRKAVMRNERFVKLGDGKMGLLPENWFNKLQKYFRVGEMEKGELKISKMKFSIIDELFDQIDDHEVLKELKEKKKRLKDFQSIKNVRIPDEIKAELRHYQIEGYNWLNYLDEFRWGGILADDMGLGKTLQVLSFLQKQASQKKETNLIVVPTTLLFNWENEILKFAPTLNFLIHHGSDRTGNYKELLKYDLVITTYGMVTNSIELLSKIKFNYIVLDESQAIKNPTSKRYKAVCLLKGNNKLAMTGTPIENNTFDLYAQLNFLNPGFLGSQQSFKNDFSKPIDGEGNTDRALELQKLVKPFVLRRTKEQVAKELPPKVEDYLYCKMEKEQRQVYEAYRNKYRDYLLSKIEENGLEKSKLFVLEGLLKLRQICDSPELLNDQEDYGRESVKIKELIIQITEKTGKHKILVFSQFVKMLGLIERELKKNKIKYEYLDGQCTPKQRKASVEVFQNDDSCRVFLISLKAGGTGLNLTAADYVYIVDPWWNPAVENQAIDRTHRIGQDKHIIAYRMICKDTVEEKIIALQNKKLKIASDIINTDESIIKSLTKEDIVGLFR